MAARRLGNDQFDTEDIRDVNNEAKRPWTDFEPNKYCPEEMLLKLGCDGFVEFHVSPSLEFLRTVAGDKYEFIFIDGDHSAKIVYQELPAALNCPSETGVILLHDYFPDRQPLWTNESVTPGVFPATQTSKNEGVKFRVLPLGNLSLDDETGVKGVESCVGGRKSQGMNQCEAN